MKPARPLGSHLLADLYDVEAGLLRDGAALESLLRRAAGEAGAQVVGSHFHSFGAEAGVTGVVLLAESHMSIHTWPESGIAAADIFMCGTADPNRALALLVRDLAPKRRHVETLPRAAPEAPVASRNVLASRAWMLRGTLFAGCALAMGLAYRAGDPTAYAQADPTLARLLRAMALIKGLVLLGLALAICLRCAWPMRARTTVSYVLTASLLAGATVLIWQLTWIGVAALTFHAALLALLVTAGRDRDSPLRMEWLDSSVRPQPSTGGRNP